MLIYIYGQFVIFLEEKEILKAQATLIKAKKSSKKDDNFQMNKCKVIFSLNNILQQDIHLFWDPPIVDDSFINTIADVCFIFIKNPSLKQDKEVRADLFGLFGNLIKTYNFGESFVVRAIQMVRMCEHVVQFMPEGVKLLVEQHGCQSIVHHLVKEATEWHLDEVGQDVQGSRCCSVLLTELAGLIPELLVPEVLNLQTYLTFDVIFFFKPSFILLLALILLQSVPLRASVLNVITEVVLKMYTKHDLSEAEKESRDDFLDILIEHMRDTAAVVRARVLANLTKLQMSCSIPLKLQPTVLELVIRHLEDKAVLVRKAAITCVTTFLQHNPLGSNVSGFFCNVFIIFMLHNCISS